MLSAAAVCHSPVTNRCGFRILTAILIHVIK